MLLSCAARHGCVRFASFLLSDECYPAHQASLYSWGKHFRPYDANRSWAHSHPLSEAIETIPGGADDVINDNTTTRHPQLAIIRMFTDPDLIDGVDRQSLAGAVKAAVRAGKPFLLPVMAEGLQQQETDAELQQDTQWGQVLYYNSAGDPGPLAAVGSGISPSDPLAGLATLSVFWPLDPCDRYKLLRFCATEFGMRLEVDCALGRPENQQYLPGLIVGAAQYDEEVMFNILVGLCARPLPVRDVWRVAACTYMQAPAVLLLVYPEIGALEGCGADPDIWCWAVSKRIHVMVERLSALGPLPADLDNEWA